jgi:hypothetical protein
MSELTKFEKLFETVGNDVDMLFKKHNLRQIDVVNFMVNYLGGYVINIDFHRADVVRQLLKLLQTETHQVIEFEAEFEAPTEH